MADPSPAANVVYSRSRRSGVAFSIENQDAIPERHRRAGLQREFERRLLAVAERLSARAGWRRTGRSRARASRSGSRGSSGDRGSRASPARRPIVPVSIVHLPRVPHTASPFLPSLLVYVPGDAGVVEHRHRRRACRDASVNDFRRRRRLLELRARRACRSTPSLLSLNTTRRRAPSASSMRSIVRDRRRRRGTRTSRALVQQRRCRRARPSPISTIELAAVGAALRASTILRWTIVPIFGCCSGVIASELFQKSRPLTSP